MKTLFYCQHSIGIGHLMRTIRLAEACLANGPVRLLCGGEIPASLDIDPAIVIDALPPLRAGKNHELIDPQSQHGIDEIFRKRAVAARRVVQEFQPHALVVEMFPFGRKKFAAEIISIITVARKASKPCVFSSVRDVLVTSRRDQAHHDQRAVDWLNSHFDALLIHSDPALIALDETFSTFRSIEIPTYYTGYIGNQETACSSERLRQVVVSAGGGRVGQKLVTTALEISATIKQELGLDMFVITGPHCDIRKQVESMTAGTKTARFINDLPETIARSTLSISQCGYNTAVDVLQSSTPAIFVPFETVSENEQLRRAELLANRGRAVLLRERQLSPESLLATSAKALTANIGIDCGDEINLAGAKRSCELIRANCCHG